MITISDLILTLLGVAGGLIIFLVTGASWVFAKLANKVDSIAVVQSEHESKHNVNDVNIKNLQEDVEFLEDRLELRRVKYKGK